ncbi:MAG: hypothetical protein OXI24_05045 [Candidatus Poribacteria bacterium]|nr:hypothetical protein [Candidatus Poribacteria bacterium]
MNSKISVHDRCIWIVDFLRRHSDGQNRTIRAIWECAKRPASKDPEQSGLEDTASLPTYHRTLAKLVRQGQVEEDNTSSDGAMLYRATDQLSEFATYTLTDINTALELSAPNALAHYIDAVDYYEERAKEVLGQAAEQLLKEDPRALILRMLQDLTEELEDDVAIIHDPEVEDLAHRSATRRRFEELRLFVNGELGISATIWSFQMFDQLERGEAFRPPAWPGVEAAIAEHVFGESFIERVEIDTDDLTRRRLIVAGTDGSTHAGYVRGVPAPQLVEEQDRLILTFNNSIAYVDFPTDYPYPPPSPYHGVPMTRSALEDPHNHGMIISRLWYDLADSEFEHMKKAALDVVQFRVDERLITGVARAYGATPPDQDTGLLPKPNILIRDGTVTPQEREFQHYCNQSSYGGVVREGIALSYNILRSVMDSENRIYAGAVKTTQLRTFSRILNWYIKRHIDTNWDLSKVSFVTDSVAVTRLLTSLPEVGEREYYRTCAIVRPFSALDSSLRFMRIESEGWLDYFRRKQEDRYREYQTDGGTPSWLIGQDLEDDAYVRMCMEADYAVFFFGKPGGEPQIRFPRFEFLDALRRLESDAREQRVRHSVERIITGVHLSKWTVDREHNFMTQRKLHNLVPFVVYEAHEKCKSLGHKLESELRQAIAMRLSQLKAIRGLPVPKVDIEPVPVQTYLDIPEGQGEMNNQEELTGNERADMTPNSSSQ